MSPNDVQLLDDLAKLVVAASTLHELDRRERGGRPSVDPLFEALPHWSTRIRAAVNDDSMRAVIARVAAAGHILGAYWDALGADRRTELVEVITSEARAARSWIRSATEWTTAPLASSTAGSAGSPLPEP